MTVAANDNHISGVYILNEMFPTRPYIILLSLFLALSCSKDGDIRTTYYPDEVITDPYMDLYQRWTLAEISGGFSGQGMPFDANTVLEFMPFGRYFIDINGVEVEKGKVDVIRQTDKELVVVLRPESLPLQNAIFGDSEKTVLTEPGQLSLAEPCCDRFIYHFL